MHALQLAKKSARCDYGLFAGASSVNMSTVCELAEETVALKMYLNETFSTLKLDDMMIWMEVSIYSYWQSTSRVKRSAESRFISFRTTMVNDFDQMFSRMFLLSAP